MPALSVPGTKLAIAESQLRDYQARLGRPFLHDSYLSELTSLRDQFKAGLSGAPHLPESRGGPIVSELAEKIKALKASHTIEATPQRGRQKFSTAEEPVTTRIHRRYEAVRNQADVQNTSFAALFEPPRHSDPRLPISFQERLIKRSRGNGGDSSSMPPL